MLPAGRERLAHICFVCCLILVSIPAVVTDTPPIFDYPNHMARAHVISRLDQVATFRTNFEVSSFIIPNVLADLVVLALIPLGGLMAAGKALLIGTFALTLSGAYALSRALSGQFSVWPLFTALLLYNEMFFWGFLNYDLGIALMLCGLASWVWLEDRNRRLQLAAATLFAVLTFLAHLVAFGLYGIAIGLLEARRLWRHWPGAAAAGLRLAGSASQAAVVLVLFFGFSPSSNLNWDIALDFSVWGKIMPFARILSSNNPGLDLFTSVATAGFLLAAVLARYARCHPAMALAGAVFLLLSLTMPYTALGSFFLDWRINIAAVLVLVAGLYPSGRGACTVAAGVLLALTGIRTAGLTDDWLTQQRAYDRVIAALDLVPRGSVVVTAVGHHFELGDWVTTRRIKPSHEHTTLYATIRRDALVPNIFARHGQNPLVFVPPLEVLTRVVRNPVPRLFTEDDARWLVEQTRAIDELSLTVQPAIPAVFIIAYAVPCSTWPIDLPIRRIRCDAAFSLVEVLAPTRREQADTDDGRAAP